MLKTDLLEALISEALDGAPTSERMATINKALRPGLEAFESGELRAITQTDDGQYQANIFAKRLILAYFKSGTNCLVAPDRASDGFDRIRLRFSNDAQTDQRYLEKHGIRIVHGAIIREGAYLGPRTVFMPSFVNIGAYVGEGTMIDTWATVGSCAQIGRRVHISGGAGIGGVLEPIGASPVIIEDDVFIGARSEVVEGVIVRRGAVLSMGVYVGKSTPIIDTTTGQHFRGEIPENAVVFPGSYDPDGSGVSYYAAVIKKYADHGTREKLKLDDTFRGKPPAETLAQVE